MTTEPLIEALQLLRDGNKPVMYSYYKLTEGHKITRLEYRCVRVTSFILHAAGAIAAAWLTYKLFYNG